MWTLFNKRNNKYIKLIKDMLVFGIGVLGSRLVLFFLVPLYTNVLSNEEYGTADLIITLGQLIMPIISIEIYFGMFRYGLSADDDNKKNTYLNTIIVFGVGTIITILLVPAFSLYRGIAPWRWYLIAYILSYFIYSNNMNYLKVKEMNKLYSAIGVLQALFLVIWNIVFLVLLHRGIGGYLLSTTLSFLGGALAAYCIGGMQKDLLEAKYDSCLMREMIAYSAPLVISSISWWVIHSSDRIMIDLMLDDAQLGLYTAASQMPSILNVVNTIFTQAWKISSIQEYDSSNESHFYSNVFKMYYIVIFGSFIVITSFIKPFMSVYVGKTFFDAWRIAPVLLLSAVFNAFSQYVGTLLETLKKSKMVMNTTLIGGMANVLINLVMITRIGVLGAAVGTLVAYWIITIVRIYDVKKYLKVDFCIPKCIIATLIASIQVIGVSCDYHGFALSIACLVSFIALINKDIISIIKKTKKYNC